MKPAPFEYVAASSYEEAAAHLGEGARVLAGGQSLVPLLNQRLVRPARIVDISRIPGEVRRTPDGLRIDATARQAALERSPDVARDWPLLAQAVRYVGHLATRTRGTVGGSVAHADPRAELPCALAALDARFELANGRTLEGVAPAPPLGRAAAPAPPTRPVPATPAAPDKPPAPRLVPATRPAPAAPLGPRDLLVAIHVPRPPAGARAAFAEYARTHGTFADAGVAVVLAPGHARVALLGAGRVPAAEEALLAGASAREAGALAAAAVPGDHRRALVAELARRALDEAGRA